MKFLIFINVFVFGCVYSLSAKQEPVTKDCVKHPQIVKVKTVTTTTVVANEKQKINTATAVKSNKVVGNTIPYFSVFNFFNFFYTKDTLDKLRVM